MFCQSRRRMSRGGCAFERFRTDSTVRNYPASSGLAKDAASRHTGAQDHKLLVIRNGAASSGPVGRSRSPQGRWWTMNGYTGGGVDPDLDEMMEALFRHHRRLTFFALADLLPAYSWRALFGALNRLLLTRCIALVPLGEDYEIVWQPSHDWCSPSRMAPPGSER